MEARPNEDDAEEAKPEEAKRREVGFGTTEEGAWRLSAILPPDEGALVEQALDAARRALTEEGQLEWPTWADALLAMADRSLGDAAASRPHHDRHLIVVHLRGENHDGPGDNSAHRSHAHLHGGPPLPDALGQLGIAGNADDPDAMVFTDAKGRQLTGCGRPAPPSEVTVTGTWCHPLWRAPRLPLGPLPRASAIRLARSVTDELCAGARHARLGRKGR